jgi:hypothetical protein
MVVYYAKDEYRGGKNNRPTHKQRCMQVGRLVTEHLTIGMLENTIKETVVFLFQLFPPQFQPKIDKISIVLSTEEYCQTTY